MEWVVKFERVASKQREGVARKNKMMEKGERIGRGSVSDIYRDLLTDSIYLELTVSGGPVPCNQP